MGMPMSYRTAVAVLLFIVTAASSAYAQTPGAGTANIEPARLQAARELLQATNADKQFATLVPLIFNQLRATMPPMEPKAQEARDQIFAEVEKQAIARRNEIVDKIAIIYAQKFTADEMRSVSDFYRTPAGQKFIAAMPELAAEGMKIGSDWGRQMALDAQQKIRDEMQKRGFKL